jgi:hypothetical protein
MAISDVGIVNSALIKLGVETISALTDNSRQADIMEEQYEKIRDALLYDHPWNFAMTWTELADGDDTHDNPDYTYMHDLPADCLRVWSVEYADEDYEVLGGKLYCDSEDINIKYIKKVTDPTLFTPAFAEALALKLAADNCFALVQSNSLKATFLEEMRRYLPTVRSADAQENPAKMLQQDIFLNARI